MMSLAYKFAENLLLIMLRNVDAYPAHLHHWETDHPTCLLEFHWLSLPSIKSSNKSIESMLQIQFSLSYC